MTTWVRPFRATLPNGQVLHGAMWPCGVLAIHDDQLGFHAWINLAQFERAQPDAILQWQNAQEQP